MQSYQVNIHDRNYTNWSLYDLSNNSTLENTENIIPLTNKLFHGDIITIQNNTINKVSGLDTKTSIQGVLVLEGNKTFGRTPNNKRLYYRCIPDNKNFPVFLVPYDIKIGFSKHQQNKYVLFKYDNWNGKHPLGELIEVLGDVNNLEVFYEYQLYCKNLHTSIKNLTNQTNNSLKQCHISDMIQNIIQDPQYKIQDRTNEYVFSIDPDGSKDFDDAFSIEKIDDIYKVSVYIANVYIWMEALDLWEYLTSRVSTIYLPDKKRPMLPIILSDSLCSLQEHELRIALAMDIYFDKDGNLVQDREIGYKNVVIKTRKNFVYEEKKLLKNKNYKEMMILTKLLKPAIQDSHELVEYWMIRMNKEVGKIMRSKETGIFRQAIYKNDTNEIYPDLDDNTSRLIRSWNNTDCKYVLYDKDIVLRHDMMDVGEYVHITSPIRRMVDLLNQIMIVSSEKLTESTSTNAIYFLDKWIKNIDDLNNNMKTIRKVQSDCHLLERCTNDPQLLESVHNCIMFGKTMLQKEVYSYMVYLTDHNILTRIKSKDEYSDLSKHTCKLFIFSDEDNIKNKIKCHVQE